MNKFVNKLYEAIDRGIQKALIITNGQENDSSIKWHEHNITSEIDIMGYYANRLLNDNNPENWYEQIIDHYNANGNKYKAESIEEVSDIFKILLNLPEKTSLNWIDMTNAIDVIYYGGFEKTLDLSKIKQNDKDSVIQFIKLKNSRCGHDIILNKHIADEKRSWQNENPANMIFNDVDCVGPSDDCLKRANNDFNGYEHTYNNVNVQDNYEDYPALEYCINLNKTYTEYECYLPAKGELKFLLDISPLLKYILWCIGGNPLYFTKTGHISSTEYSDVGIWVQLDQNTCNVGHKLYTSSVVLPLFRKK